MAARRSAVALSEEVTRELRYRFRLAAVLGAAAAIMVLGSAPKGALRGPFWLPMLGLLVLGSVLLALGGYGIRALLG